MKQIDHFWKAHKKIAEFNDDFMWLINCKENPMTNEDLRKLIEKRPKIYGRFSAFLGKLED